MRKPLRLVVNDTDVNALTYLWSVVRGCMDTVSELDRDVPRAIKLLTRLQHETWLYEQANNILPTPQWEHALCAKNEKDLRAAKKKYKAEGCKVLTIHRPNYDEVDLYILKKGAV